MAAGTLSTKSKKKSAKNESLIYFELTGIVICFFSLFAFFSLLSPKSFGSAGIFLNILGKKTLGPLALFITPYFLYQGIYLIKNQKFDIAFNRYKVGIILFYFALLSFVHLLYLKFTDFSLLQIAQQGEGGGFTGYILSFVFISIFGKIGALLFTLTLIAISQTLVFTNFTSLAFHNISDYVLEKWQHILIKKETYLQQKRELKEKLAEEKNKKEITSNNQKENTDLLSVNENETQVLEENSKELIENKISSELETEDILIPLEKIKEEKLVENSENLENFEDNYESILVNKNLELKLPPLSLLKDAEPLLDRPRTVKEQGEKIIQTLKDFGIEAEMVAINIGPRITRYEVQPAIGVKVREIITLQDDLALHLAASPIRVEAPIPGKSAIGIEVPNKEKSTVYLKELLEHIPEFNASQTKIYFALGKDIAGNHQVSDLTKMPHLLIAGATGSGKSVCINSIIASILFTTFPDEIKLLLIDPKRVELTLYNGIPHLLAPVIVDAKLASAALEVMIKEMEDRYDLFAERGVRNIQSFNKKFPEEKLSYFVIFIDELADLMFQSAAEVERNICRLAQLARATGIHLVIATQRPSVNVITGLIKANVPSRLSFAVASQTDSRTVLDMAGAEKLLGEGDMLFKPIEATKPKRIQGAFISEDETNKVVNFWKAQAEPEYDNRFENLESVQTTKTQQEIEEEDDLFNDAVNIILSTGQASQSQLQRKLRIGFARAGRLMDQIADRGIVGPNCGSKPREILISYENWQAQQQAKE